MGRKSTLASLYEDESDWSDANEGDDSVVSLSGPLETSDMGLVDDGAIAFSMSCDIGSGELSL